MTMKSFFNFFMLNAAIFYLTNSSNIGTSSEASLKILLYSYFNRSLWSLFSNEFLYKYPSHHDLSIFSISNIAIFLIISILNMTLNYCILLLCFENSFLMMAFSNILLIYCHLFWQKLNISQGEIGKKFLLFFTIFGFVISFSFLTNSFKQIIIPSVILCYILINHLLWKTSIVLKVEVNEIITITHFFSGILMLIYFIFKIINETGQNNEESYSLSSYFFYFVCVGIFSFNIKHGEGCFHFSESSFFKNLKSEGFSITVFLSSLFLLTKLQIIALQTDITLVFIVFWSIFFIVNSSLTNIFTSNDLETLPISENQKFTNQSFSYNDDLIPLPVMDVTYSLEGFWKVIKQDRNSRKIFILLTINFSFTFIEFIYGILGNSLSLISDSAHMLFDASALAIGLYAAFMAKLKPDSRYTYGYARFQVLSGFINAIFLMFVAFSIFNEALERIMEPQFVNSRQIILVSVIGFIINIIGLCFFHEHSHFIEHYENDINVEELNHDSTENNHAQLCDKEHHGEAHECDINEQISDSINHSHGKKLKLHDNHNNFDKKENFDGDLDKKVKNNHFEDHKHEDHKHEDHKYEDHKHEDHDHHMHEHDHHHNENLYGVFLHIAADTLGSIGVILSLILIELFQWYIADAIASFIISILILASVIPLVKSSAEILLQSYPKKYEKKLKKLLENINKIPEITSCKDINLWAYTSNYLVCTICVTRNQESNDEQVSRQLRKIIKKFHQIKHSTLQIQCDSVSDK